ncbi:MAG: hypothetical protein GY918_05935, partial [Gammaproteobacteria bacterium]|nr:hypothetical protein [Gammaproteobacteria bacterium]
MFTFSNYHLGTGWSASTLGANHHLFDGNTFSGNTGTVIDPGPDPSDGSTNYYGSKTTITANTFVNNGVNWTGAPAVTTGNVVTVADTTPPVITITAAGVNSGAVTNDATLSLTFTSSESTTDFVLGDVTVVNGTLSNFAGSGATYTATFTPVSDGVVTIDVASDVFTDAAGNSNVASNQFNWTYDGTAPAISSATVASDNSTIIITMSESVYNTSSGSGDLDVTDFALSISGGNATLSSVNPSSIAISGNVYTLGISLSGTPNGSEVITVLLVDNSIYDGVGNEANATTSYSVGDVGPGGGIVFFVKSSYSNTSINGTISGGPIDGQPIYGGSLTTSLTSSELAALPFDYMEAAPAGWDGVAGTDPKRPYESESGDEIPVDDDGVIIGTGQANTDALVTKFQDVDSPSDNAALLANSAEINSYSDWFLPSIEELALMFTNLYVAGDIGGFGTLASVGENLSYRSSTDGRMLNFDWSPYSGNTGDWDNDAGMQHVRPVRSFASSSNITINLFDQTAPTITVTATDGSNAVSSGSTTSDSTLSIVFTLSESATDFDATDITVTNGTLSNFTALSGTEYTATLTPAASGAVTLDVASAAFTDAAGNNNTAATQYTWTYVAPNTAPVISSATITPGSPTGGDTLTVSATASDADQDTITLSYQWAVNGQAVSGATGATFTGGFSLGSLGTLVAWYDG